MLCLSEGGFEGASVGLHLYEEKILRLRSIHIESIFSVENYGAPQQYTCACCYIMFLLTLWITEDIQETADLDISTEKNKRSSKDLSMKTIILFLLRKRIGNG